MSSTTNDAFPGVFAVLRPLLAKHTEGLIVTRDEANWFSLDTPHVMKNKLRLFFGSVQIKKNYVSYHLMAVYSDPDLLDGVSGPLKKRMQGKSCFNFKKIDEPLFDELSALTDACAARYRDNGYVT